MNGEPVNRTEKKVVGGPPFTVEQYGSLGDAITAERNYLRVLLAEANSGHFNTSRIREYLDWWKHG